MACLTEDPNARISAAELMRHRWMNRRHQVGQSNSAAVNLSGVAKVSRAFMHICGREDVIP